MKATDGWKLTLNNFSIKWKVEIKRTLSFKIKFYKDYIQIAEIDRINDPVTYWVKLSMEKEFIDDFVETFGIKYI